MAGSRLPIAVAHGEGYANFRDRGNAQQAIAALRFTDNAAVGKHETIILAYLKEAMSYSKDGIRAPKEKPAIELPAELVDALDADDDLADAFRNLTPGRQKSYVINLNTTKNPATRIARIAKFRDRILAGKGATDR
jgi:uncharacterized protein YdeI (YjbR/CyaY-like superfamily)